MSEETEEADEAEESASPTDPPVDPEAAATQGERAEAALDPSPDESEPSFDVTTGEDLVDRLPSGSEVPDELQRTFWTTVLLLKVALLAGAGAVLLAYFRGQLLYAGVLAAISVIAAVRTAQYVRGFDGEFDDA